MKGTSGTASENFTVVGRRVVRVDARAKLSGEARYSADFLEVEALQGKILRSPYAHAEIVRIDPTPAESLPGVRAVVTFRDAPQNPFEEGDTEPPQPVAPVYVLNSVVRHVGDEVAAVAADTLEIAEEALAKIEVEYRQFPFVLDAEAAIAEGAPVVRGGGTNVAGRKPIFFERGDAGAGLAEADLVLEGTYRTQSTSPLSLEPRFCVARWDGDRLTVWKSSRHVHGDRNRLAKVFALPPENVRVVGMYMGAGFGSKDESRLAAITALAARKAGRPVRIGYTREEELAFGKWRHATVTRIKMGLKRDGSITAIDAKSVLNTGPYAPGFGVAQRLGHGLTYLYTTANARYEGKVAFTNAPVAGSYRGLGAPQAHFALESLADEAAERLGMDPLEFRLRNHVRPEGQPGTRQTPEDEIVPAQPIEGGIPFSSNYLRECLEEGAKRIGWKPRPGGPRKLLADGKYRGMGLAACIYKTGQNSASAVVKVKPDGTAELLMSTMEIGQGAWTILAQIAAETLGMKFENVKGIFADTDITPFAHSTSGSTTTFTSGWAALLAAEDAKRQIFETASRLLEVPVGELEAREGLIFPKGERDHHIPIGHVVARRENRLVVGKGSLRAGSKTHIINSFAAHFAEVEVDPESGIVKVLRYVAVHDSGRIIHPEAAYGQIVGGVVQGLGYALMEDIPLDPESGAPITLNLDTFKIPNLVDVPVIEPVFLNRPDPLGPYGAKALGEPPLVPVAAAIANAVYDATGVRIRELPITAEKVLAGIRQLKRKN
ncbi:MAG TPA: xanthine dehydrogenase family protein molybdopterin-binding subunit [Candidatus Acidoferrales bacterium]|nr:xanthine dehydrogenase family protein molybdopterin-binding subunit [Candidatus Acidoferrales bacterium]